MKLHVSHERRALAPLLGVGAEADFAAEAAVLPWPLDAQASVFACEVEGNPLSDGFLIDATLPSPRVIAWSGRSAAGGAAGADDMFERSPLTWAPWGADALRRFCAEVAPQLERASMRLLFRPHARHVLSDVPRVRQFLEANEGEPFGIALDPLLLLEPDMLDDAPDHLRRTLEVLGEAVDALYLGNVALDRDADDPPVRSTALHRGDLDAEVIVRAFESSVGADRPVILRGADLEGQLACLGVSR